MGHELSRPIEDPAVWTSASLGGKSGLVHRLREDHLEGVRSLIARTRHLPIEEIGRDAFDHPAVNELMSSVRRELMSGRGAAILCGVDLARFTEEEFKRICWGLGTHLGSAAPQSYRRDRLGFVQKEEDNPTGRGYLMDVELRSHTDFHEILCLACVRRSASGGESGLASSLAVHNAILATHPQLLPPLYEGFYQEWAGEQRISPDKIPIFARVEEQVSCYYHPLALANGARELAVSLPAQLDQAMQAFRALADGPALRLDFMLEPGEIMLWHNFVVLHSRRAFRDSPSQRRLLLRLWLNVPQGRAMHPAFTGRARAMDREHENGRPAIDYTRHDTFRPLPLEA
ncbi:MAG TPA: TauD/TfdA family dioxygenase [Steroidobacteraceae bacterium]|nr:TauD/TfdA family dioxygenase [Steroidobacteraceae bacterium]